MKTTVYAVPLLIRNERIFTLYHYDETIGFRQSLPSFPVHSETEDEMKELIRSEMKKQYNISVLVCEQISQCFFYHDEEQSIGLICFWCGCLYAPPSSPYGPQYRWDDRVQFFTNNLLPAYKPISLFFMETPELAEPLLRFSNEVFTLYQAYSRTKGRIWTIREIQGHYIFFEAPDSPYEELYEDFYFRRRFQLSKVEVDEILQLFQQWKKLFTTNVDTIESGFVDAESYLCFKDDSHSSEKMQYLFWDYEPPKPYKTLFKKMNKLIEYRIELHGRKNKSKQQK